METNRQVLDISWETILKVCFTILVFYMFYLVRDIVIWFFFGLIISVLLDPAIDFFKKFRIPRIVAAIITYFLIFGALGAIIYLAAPLFVTEIKQFSQLVPQYFQNVGPVFKELRIESLQSIENLAQTITSSLEQVSFSIFNALGAFFGGIVSAIFILLVAFFLSLEDDGVDKALALLAPKRYEEYVLALFQRCKKKVSAWFGTRILACLFVALASLIVFYLFDVRYTFILAFLSGILSFVPFLGPLVVTILLVLIVGLSDGWIKAFIVVIAFTLIHQVEGNILSPILTKKLVGLPTVLVLLALAIGGEIFGFLGAVFSIPVAGIIYEFTKEFLEKKKEMEY